MKTNLKRIMSAMLAVVMTMAMTTSAFAASFTDVPEKHWSYNFVEKAVANGLVAGKGNGKYDPNADVSNAEWCQMVANLFLGDELPKATGSTQWWEPAADYATQADFLNGTKFVSNRAIAGTAISRYDMAQVIYNIAQTSYLDMNAVDTTNISKSIADYKDVPGNYRTAVEYCYAAGFIVGYDAAGSFGGDRVMTRGAAATVLVRLFDAQGNSSETPVEPTTPAETTPPVEDVINTAVKDMISLAPSTLAGCDYDITVDNTYHAGKLSNGKAITNGNITAMLNEIKAIFPNGTSWGDDYGGDNYLYNTGNPAGYGGGCAAWAGMVGDVLFGEGADWTVTDDLYDVKPGDLIELKNTDGSTQHWVVVTSAQTITNSRLNFETNEVTEYETVQITMCDGNANDKVSWNAKMTIDVMLDMYSKCILYSAY